MNHNPNKEALVAMAATQGLRAVPFHHYGQLLWWLKKSRGCRVLNGGQSLESDELHDLLLKRLVDQKS